MVPYKFLVFKDEFTRDSAVFMFNYFRGRGYSEDSCFRMTFANLKNGFAIDGRGRKVSVDYNLTKYSDEELKAKLERERLEREAKAKPKELPKATWIQKGLFDE